MGIHYYFLRHKYDGDVCDPSERMMAVKYNNLVDDLNEIKMSGIAFVLLFLTITVTAIIGVHSFLFVDAVYTMVSILAATVCSIFIIVSDKNIQTQDVLRKHDVEYDWFELCKDVL